MKTIQKSIVVFDGECNLCNGVVGWLLRFAPSDIFRFVAFQSTEGQSILKKYNFPLERLETVILLDEYGVNTRSDGFLKIVSSIPRWRVVAALLTYIPRIVRDTIYNVASRNRMKWFGKATSCTINFR